jgi:DNA-binding MarR family transcriptional regulator
MPLKKPTQLKRRAQQLQPVKSGSTPWRKLAPSGTNLHVEDFLTFRLSRLSNALRTNLTKRYLEEFNLSVPEWRLLALVTRFSPLRFSELTARSSMDKGQVSRTLRTMTKRGYVKARTIRSSYSADALAAPVEVSISAKGRALHRTVLPVARRKQAQLLLTLSEADRNALYSTLDKLFATIGNGVATADEPE